MLPRGCTAHGISIQLRGRSLLPNP
eukprot:SAG31_NODE_43554_length_266_cov_1.221557_1_plen_24_part_01